MMLFSRFWYAILAIVGGAALYASFLAVGQYNRRSVVATSEAVAADSQVVKWALQIDARRRLDAMLLASVDKDVQQSLLACVDKDKVPAKARDDARKALAAVAEKMPADYKNDVLFAVDRDGRLVAQIGYDRARAFEDFELGGYAAVYDALHGYLRDDTWVWGDVAYRVVARPVEYDTTQAPVGAVIGLRMIDRKFAQDISALTRANVAFYAGGQRVASGASEGFDDNLLDVADELPKLETDAAYKDKGRSEVRALGAGALSAVFTRIDGEAYAQGIGFAVVRSRVSLPGPLAFLTQADDKDKASVDLRVIVGFVAGAFLIGVLLTALEHNGPRSKLAREAARLRKGEIDLFQLQVVPGAYRAIATDLNAGIERVAEKGGGAPRKAADLESILGPALAQPAMSAFSFPEAAPADAPPGPRAQQAAIAKPAPPTLAGEPRPQPPPAPRQQPAAAPPAAIQLQDDPDEGESTSLAEVRSEPARAVDGDAAEWPGVYDDFVRTKKECGESTEGLTLEKFAVTLKKNRDALVQRHGCKRVKFTVYVKDGRASLKATPLKD